MVTVRTARTLTCLGCLALPGLAYAGDVETWIGGAASGGVEVGADGAGGIGIELQRAITYTEFDTYLAILLLIVGMIFLIDIASEAIRHRLIGLGEAR